MLKVENMRSPRTGREVPNQFVIRSGDKTMFQSYQSPIVEIDYYTHAIHVYEDWNYSRTTSKYRNQFLDEQGFYELVGEDLSAVDSCKINGRTWEIVREF